LKVKCFSALAEAFASLAPRPSAATTVQFPAATGCDKIVKAATAQSAKTATNNFMVSFMMLSRVNSPVRQVNCYLD